MAQGPEQAAEVAAALEARRADLGIAKIYSGKALVAEFGDPAKDSRVPDIFLEVENGVIYTKPTATKIAEHGGFGVEDRHVGMIVAAPGVKKAVVATPVETLEIAPTVLRLLGLDAKHLDAVAKTGVKLAARPRPLRGAALTGISRDLPLSAPMGRRGRVRWGALLERTERGDVRSPRTR